MIERLIKYSALFIVLSFATAIHAQSLLPLDAGNQWTYRERGGTDSFTIRVGNPVEIADHTYYPVTGYVTDPVSVRFTSPTALYYYDTATSQDILLTTFETLKGIGYFIAPFRTCELVGQGQPERNEFRGPAGRFDEALTILYRTPVCADEGILNEVYVPGIGMVQRTVNSFRGPRIYDLVTARIGKATVQADRGAYLRVALQEQPGMTRVTANIDLVVIGDQPVPLHFLTSQDADVVLRSADGKVVWHYAEGRIYTQSIRDENSFGKSSQIDVPLADASGAPLAPGTYLLEAWIPGGYDRPQFTSTVGVTIPAPGDK